MSKQAIVIGLIISTALPLRGYCRSDANRLSEADIDAMLFQLKPLPKVHYSTPLSLELLNNKDSRRLYELVRIMHSVCVWGQWATSKQIDNCVYTCARVNKTKPVVKASIAVMFSPWVRIFGKDLPPTDRGPTYWQELEDFEEHSLFVKREVEKANKKYESDVEISAILLDCERFYVLKGNEKWNEAVKDKLDDIHIRAQAIFPKARIEWYGRGVGVASVEEGWAKSRIWTGKEIKAPLSCSLYTVPEIERTRETFRRTCKLADEMGISDVTPYVALAAGYRRGLEKVQYFDSDWSYDIIYSYLLGAELNNKWYGDRPKRFAPYNRAKVVVFYPPAFDKRCPDWPRHFIAYVRGATGVKELKDLGYEE
jgi:hypothetical protein